MLKLVTNGPQRPGEVRLCADAFCVREIDLPRIARGAVAGEIACVDGSLYKAKFCEVDYNGAIMLADVVTGTLYRESGECVTTDQLAARVRVEA